MKDVRLSKTPPESKKPPIAPQDPSHTQTIMTSPDMNRLFCFPFLFCCAWICICVMQSLGCILMFSSKGDNNMRHPTTHRSEQLMACRTCCVCARCRSARYWQCLNSAGRNAPLICCKADLRHRPCKRTPGFLVQSMQATKARVAKDLGA